eukprot:Opistho-2@50681
MRCDLHSCAHRPCCSTPCRSSLRAAGGHPLSTRFLPQIHGWNSIRTLSHCTTGGSSPVCAAPSAHTMGQCMASAWQRRCSRHSAFSTTTSATCTLKTGAQRCSSLRQSAQRASTWTPPTLSPPTRLRPSSCTVWTPPCACSIRSFHLSPKSSISTCGPRFLCAKRQSRFRSCRSLWRTLTIRTAMMRLRARLQLCRASCLRRGAFVSDRTYPSTLKLQCTFATQTAMYRGRFSRMQRRSCDRVSCALSSHCRLARCLQVMRRTRGVWMNARSSLLLWTMHARCMCLSPASSSIFRRCWVAH